MKRYIPERGEIRYGGVRQYMKEDLDYLLDLRAEISRLESIWTLTQEMAVYRHIEVLRDLKSTAYTAFIAKWNKP